VYEWLGYRLYWSGRLDALERHLDENPNERWPDGDGWVLVLTHVFDDRALGAQHTAGCVVYLNRLDSDLAGNLLSEQEAHEAFPSSTSDAESFRLEPDLGREAFGRHPRQQRLRARRPVGRPLIRPGSSSTLELTRRRSRSVRDRFLVALR
jgi:hypothetical protein